MDYAQRFKTENTDINCYIKVVGSAAIRNISIGGVSIETNFRLNRDTIYPVEIEDDDHNLKFEATAIWSNIVLHKESADLRSNFIPVYSAGIQFSHDSKEDPDKIMNYIKKFKQERDNKDHFLIFTDRRRNARSRIDKSGKCFLNFTVDCRVQELGISSMLTKSGHELEYGSRILAVITQSGNEPLKIPGRIVSCSFTGGTDTGQVFETGIEFTEASDEERERIKSLVRSTIVSDSVRKFKGGNA